MTTSPAAPVRKRVLLTGVSGQLGWELRRTLLPLANLVCAAGPRDAVRGAQPLDLANPEALRNLIRQARPDIIINPAAYTQVDQAEEELDLARAINATAPGVFAEEAHRCGAFLIHYSTDYVFAGQGRKPFLEQDTSAPINAYGRTKCEGEDAIRTRLAAHLILRTSWLYSARGNNFLRTILRLANDHAELRIVDDQIGAPTWARMLAEATAQILAEAGMLGRDWLEERAGTYHLTATGETSWYGFARAILGLAPEHYTQAKLFPIPTSDYPTKAARPAYSVLDCSAAARTFGISLGPWQEHLERVMEDLNTPASGAFGGV